MNFDRLSDGNWQNFIYLLLLLAMMVAGVVSRRDLDFKKILKYLCAWSIIGFIFVALYSYRYEFSDFKGRILGEINPSRAQVSDLGEIEINAAQDGHFYLDTKINGVAITFMIDTGASDIVIGVDEAKKIGINPKNLNFIKRYQTANGISLGASVILKELEFGDLQFLNVEASVNNANMGTSLMGMSFLRRFKKYEFYRDKLVLTI